MYPNLEAEIARYKLHNAEIAKAINIAEKSFSNKRTGKTEFTVSEIFAIQRKLFPKCNIEYLFATEAE